MQDRYAADIGDYIKLALLKVLSPGRKLGVSWYRTPDEHHNMDGKHVAYLGDDLERKWRHFDPELFDQLKAIVAEDRRSIAALEAKLIPGDVRFHSTLLSTPASRAAWLAGMKQDLGDRDLVFVDPDNGIAPDGWKPGRAKSVKSITYDEIWSLHFPSRPLIVYHHQSHFAGGHEAEIAHLGGRLRARNMGAVGAIRARPSSPRVFFLIGFNQELWARAKGFCEVWGYHVSFHNISGPPDQYGLSPDDPYSERAESTEENMVRRVEAGELDHLFPKPPLRLNLSDSSNVILKPNLSGNED